MDFTINEEYIKKIIKSYETLGFVFDEKDIFDSNVRLDRIRVSFMNENKKCTKKQIRNITDADYYSAFNYSNIIADSNEKIKLNQQALKDLLVSRVLDNNKNELIKEMFEYIIECKRKEEIEEYIEEDKETIEEDNVVEQEANDTVKEANDTVKVVDVEEDEEVATKAKQKMSKDSVLITASIIILASVIGFAAYSKSSKSDNNVAIEETTEINNDIEVTNTVKDDIEDVDTNEVTEEVPVVEDTTEELEEVADIEETEEVQETVNVHSDEFISTVTDKALSSIQLINDKYIVAKYNRDLVEDLVRYTHHNYEEYVGLCELNNEDAYELLSELIRHGYDISIFYEGLNNFENIRALNTAATSIKQEKGQYEDEFKVYMCMDVIMNDMNTNNYPEAIALRAYVDNYSMIPSMQMARQQAGVLEMKDTQDLWIDVNKDGKVTYEENAEGRGYEEEKARAMAAKYGEMDSQKCAQIYNRVSTDNQNSELTQIVYKAIDEDEAKVRVRN